jgi:hypothetical protein
VRGGRESPDPVPSSSQQGRRPQLVRGRSRACMQSAELRWRAWPGKLGAPIDDVQKHEVAEMIAGLSESAGCVALFPTNSEGLERPAL